MKLFPQWVVSCPQSPSAEIYLFIFLLSNNLMFSIGYALLVYNEPGQPFKVNHIIVSNITDGTAYSSSKVIAELFNGNDENLPHKTYLINPFDAVYVNCMLGAA